jgi:hypothetical protein
MNFTAEALLSLGLCAAATLGASRATANGPHGAAAAASPVTLTWTTDVVSWTGGDWDTGVQTASAWVEGGYDDWRLPKVEELQAALQDGSWGQDPLHAGYAIGHWTSKNQGIWAYKVTVATDPLGNVIPSQSGASKKVLKTSNLVGGKFVRP